jgi:hypothetical protein
MPKTTGDQLRDMLSRQIQAASDEAVRSGGQVSAEQVETLGRLARLVDLHQSAQPPSARKRWPVAVALGSTLLVVSLLVFARVAETEIELDLALSEASFVLPTQQVLAESMNLVSLGVSGLSEAQLPQVRNRESQTLQSSDNAEVALRLLAILDGKRLGSVTLAPLALPAETRVWVRHTGLPRQYRLSLKASDLKLRADINGLVQIGIPGRGLEQLDFAAPDAVLLQSGAGEVDLDLAFPDKAQLSFSSQLSANDLSLFRIDEFLNLNQTLIRRVSTILSGTLYFVSLNDQERKLRPGEAIRFERAQGEIRTLRLQEDQIELKFHGRVRGMTIGAGESSRSLMPTWLEWLRARHSLSLLWGAALYLFGLVTVVFRWWGKPI